MNSCPSSVSILALFTNLEWLTGNFFLASTLYTEEMEIYKFASRISCGCGVKVQRRRIVEQNAVRFRPFYLAAKFGCRWIEGPRCSIWSWYSRTFSLWLQFKTLQALYLLSLWSKCWYVHRYFIFVEIFLVEQVTSTHLRYFTHRGVGLHRL